MRTARTLAIVCVSLAATAAWAADNGSDPWLWLEDIEGQRAVEWVKAQNAVTLGELESVDVYEPIRARALEILDSEDKLAVPGLRGGHVYNLWQDREHERGVWRRTTLASYRTGNPEWVVLLDLDALSAAEGVPWVLGSVECLAPAYDRCMLGLAPGGSDAEVLREFDVEKRSFVEGGFEVPEAKSTATWKDADTLLVATDTGAGILTTAGYPRTVREWHRGTPLEAAPVLFEVPADDALVGVAALHEPEGRYLLLTRVKDFFHTESFLMLDGRVVRLAVPEDAQSYGFFDDQMLLKLRSEWTVGARTFPVGSLVAVDLDALLRGRPTVESVFEPTGDAFLDDVALSRDTVVMTTLEHVRTKLYRVVHRDGVWVREEIVLPGMGTVRLYADRHAEAFLYSYQDFLTPPSMYVAGDEEPRLVQQAPAFFKTDGLEVTQLHATSPDGTSIPYFLVRPSGQDAQGPLPTLLNAYGGFEVNRLPRYDAVLGVGWLERGGAFVLANIRGGGEFGPEWHTAAVRERHIHNFEDFAAVADDLVARGLTTRDRLGIIGGSQGGLLVGGTFVLRPDLCGAVVCEVPLLDMKRYHKLLAGASWISEYGNPDVASDWEFMKSWSPYQLVTKDADYPPVFFWANHRDDRVHPGHARKMAAKMLSQGHDVLYYEHLEGGHAAGAVNSQRAAIEALEYAFLWKELGSGEGSETN